MSFMKIFEREEMLIKQGQEQGQLLEQANTERERQRADSAEQRAAHAEQEIKRLKELLAAK